MCLCGHYGVWCVVWGMGALGGLWVVVLCAVIGVGVEEVCQSIQGWSYLTQSKI